MTHRTHLALQPAGEESGSDHDRSAGGWTEAMTTPADRAVLLQKVSELLLESRPIVKELEAVPDGESSAAADRIAYGILVAAIEEGLVTTIRHAVEVLKRFRAPAGVFGVDRPVPLRERSRT